MGPMLLSSDVDSRHCIVGFDDGTVRVLKRCLDGWKLISAVKPHKAWARISRRDDVTPGVHLGTGGGCSCFARIGGYHLSRWQPFLLFAFKLRASAPWKRRCAFG